MKIRKAVIPAAGYGTRFLPATKSQPKEMLPIVDKPTIQFIVEEAVASGIEEIIIITSHQKTAIENHFDRSLELEAFLKAKGNDEALELVKDISDLATIYSVRQKEQKGLGHAILCAKSFIGNEPFAILLGDDIVVNGKPATKQLCDIFHQTNASVVGVQEVPISDVSKYGIVKPNNNIDMDNRLSEINDIVEKPKAEAAPSQMAVLGRYILTPEIFPLLETQTPGSGGEIQLTDAIQRLISLQKVYAYNFEGKRYDVGNKLGFLEATVDFALDREDLRDDFQNMLLKKVNLSDK